MTTSGVTTFSVSRDDIIKSSLRALGVIAEGETPTAQMIFDCNQALNMIIKSWQARGVGLWLNQQVTIPLAYEQQMYYLGPTGSNATASMVETSIATAAVAGAGSIVVDSISGMSTGQYIGIQLDDGTMQWTTINGAPSGVTVTLTAVLTDSAAVGNVVFAYSSKVSRPLEIKEMRLRDASGIDTPLEMISRQEYMDLPLKSSSGKPTQYYYDPQLSNGTLFVWPTAASVSDRLVGTIRIPVQDFVNIADTPDFPQEWFRALKFKLAQDLLLEYTVAPNQAQLIIGLAQDAFDEANLFDRETASTRFAPDRRY